MGTARLIIIAVAVGVSLLFVYGLLAQKPSVEGLPAPGFTLPLYGGGEVTLAELRGKVVVLNFWATWCAPCRAEAPVLEEVWREYRDRDVLFLGVNVKDVADKAQSFVQQMGITYPNGYDPYGKLWKAYRLTGVPETFFIGRDGKVAKRHVGPITEAELRAGLDELLP